MGGFALPDSMRKLWLVFAQAVTVTLGAIFVVSLAFNLLGDGMRDALDPKAAK